MAKMITMPKTSRQKTTVKTSKNAYRASTCQAMVEAWAGKSGKSDMRFKAPN